jgi:hypothetical protein
LNVYAVSRGKDVRLTVEQDFTSGCHSYTADAIRKAVNKY